MSNALIVNDPYRNAETTLAEFARAEGVPKRAVSHFYWWHKTLDGFRDRPAKGTGSGIKPHTYTRNGVYLSINEAQRILGMSYTTLNNCRDKYGTHDIDEIRRRYDADQAEYLKTHSYETDDGRMMTPAAYAKELGVTYNAVALWVSRKGTLKGYTTRGRSRLNPTQYPHSGLGVVKSIGEWAKHYAVDRECVKTYLRMHGRDMRGFETRKKRGNPLSITYNGRQCTIPDLARRLGVKRSTLYHYYRTHRTLEGYNPRQKQGRPTKAA